MDRQTWSPQMTFSFHFKKNANKMGSSRHLIKPFLLLNNTSSHTNLIFLILQYNIKSLGTNFISNNLNQLNYRTGYTIFILVLQSSSSTAAAITVVVIILTRIFGKKCRYYICYIFQI